ncbi:transporter substrate-binding domain-containing protein [Pseudomonas capeferrum]|uniref:transporter substrate-binding domain-containing protein n=1 Tax=Pseudomonas capeferrum TaxID=1495066 RepID=UPI001C613451|nr:transporter substrate-binding domain-containing protein [Pseudomonas capeferrum]MBA1205377.1 transporter substrate-binding domain-containing protein [Pseudomonas capeferrum]
MRALAMLLCHLICLAPLQAAELPMLYGRASLSGPRLIPDDDQLRWLWQRSGLKLGIVLPENPPFDILTTGREYEGITADYASLLGQHLQREVQVRTFSSLGNAMAALREGDVDLLGSITAQQAREAGVLLSTPYAQDRPILVAHDERPPQREAGEPVRLAMREGYRDLDSVLARFPNAQVRVFPSTRGAVGAVVFGQADLYLGGELESQYLIGKGQVKSVEVIAYPDLAAQPVAFAMAVKDAPLKALVDRMLAITPAQEHERIRHRWAVEAEGVRERGPLRLTPAEDRWLSTHPRVRVLLGDQFVPFSYRDGEGHLRGLSIDMLRRIERLTGLSFDLEAGGTVEEMIEQVRQGKAEVIAGLTPSPRREEQLAFTRAYLSTVRVLVTRNSEQAPDSLELLQGKRLAVIGSGAPAEYLRQHHPGIRLVESDGPLDAIWRVASSRADAAVLPLLGAWALTSRLHPGRIKISATLPMEPAHFALATARGAQELHSILNKALLSLSPHEMDMLAHRWRGEVIVADTFWQRYRFEILQGFAVVALLLLGALVWVRYLRYLIGVRKQAERALAEQLAFMRVMIDGTPHPIYVCDREGRLLTCNSSYLQAVGASRAAAIGQPVGSAEGMAWQGVWREVLAAGEARVEDCQVSLTDGRRMTFYHWMLPYRNQRQELSGVIAGWIDVTERQCLQLQLQRAKEDAESANHAKTHFLATMSHEIRTPMNAVLGMLELALRKAEQGVLDRLSIEVASDAARSLLALVGDILDVTRIESGHLELAPAPVQLSRHVAGVVQLFEQQAQAKGLQLLLELEGEVDTQVMLDPLRFKQILANLISNAIKFTHKGSVRVRLRVTSQGDEWAASLRVEDTGIGIPEGELSRLGSLFWQASNNRQSARRGAGLGLSISRTLCELMGGRMKLRSTQGVGTRVDIDLMLEAVTEGLARPTAEVQGGLPGQAGLRVLVVDDYPANRLLMSNQLAYLGHRASLAEDGAQALRLWLSKGFDVIITDCNMPVLDGYALAKAIRAHERRRGLSRCRVLGVTANALPAERKRCRQAGMDDCLFKPLSLKALAEVLDAPLAARRARDEAGGDEQALDLSSLQRLTGGDAQALRALLDDLLESNRQDLDQLSAYRDGDEPGGLAELAHRIKGGARIIKARVLIEACEQLERSCASGESSPTLLAEQCEAVRQAMLALEDRLQRHGEAAPGSGRLTL